MLSLNLHLKHARSLSGHMRRQHSLISGKQLPILSSGLPSSLEGERIIRTRVMRILEAISEHGID